MVISETGFARKKARISKRVATKLLEEFGKVSLEILEGMSVEEAEDFLLQLHGVGPKTAKCVLMYALDHPVFPSILTAYVLEDD